jgi:hypothetical protein
MRSNKWFIAAVVAALCAFAQPAHAAITYFNSNATVADNGFGSAIPMAVTPPASMVTGDLAIVVVPTKSSAGTLSVSETGGQSWTVETQVNANTLRVIIAWCRFNGTWSADPSFTSDAAIDNGINVIMHVFRPSDGANTWGIDVAGASFALGTPGGPPPTSTITGITTVAASTVSLAVWWTTDDNQYQNLAGAGWVQAGSQQYRNQQGTDWSTAQAYQIKTSAGATGNVSKDVYETDGTTATNNAQTGYIIAFKEIGGGGGGTKKCPGLLLGLQGCQ